MSGERGQRTTLVFGGVAVEVSLTKTSSKPTEAKHDVRRMIGDKPADQARAEALARFAAPLAPSLGLAAAPGETAEQLGDRVIDRIDPVGDPFGDDEQTEAESLADTLAPAAQAPPDPFAELPPERVEHGVYLDDGSFVDLTDRLREIDERTRIEGMEVVATIAAGAVPRYRVRDSHWIGLAAGKTGGSPKVLALLWQALRGEEAAAVVRWTKRTNQALGIIVASGSIDRGNAALCLLECEWADNMRPPGARATTPILVEAAAREVQAATQLAKSLRTGVGFLNAIRDERNEYRADLLTAAREGRVGGFDMPPVPERPSAVGDIADRLTAAAASA